MQQIGFMLQKRARGWTLGVHMDLCVVMNECVSGHGSRMQIIM